MSTQGAPTQELSLADVMEYTSDYVRYSVNCHQVGKIESYDKDSQTAEVSVGVKRRLANGEEATYPLLLDVPVVILSGGGASLTFPISKGDKCIILFNDRDIDVSMFLNNLLHISL